MNRSTVSPLGSLLADLRAEGVHSPTPSRPARTRQVAPRPPRPAGAPEPDLLLESGIVSGGRPLPARSWRWVPALALHGAGLVALVILPVLIADELPSPSAAASKVFLVPAPVAPPMPPAPPARRAAAADPAPRKAGASTPAPSLAVPVAPVAEIKRDDMTVPAPPPAIPMLPADEGVPGGVEEGVPGGIVGGVIEPASVRDTEPSAVRVGGEIKEPRKLKNVAPVYPAVAAAGKVEGVVILEIEIRPSGRVEDVRVLRGVPLLDAAAVDAARQWVFAPTLYRGVPVSVTMTVSVRFSLTQSASAS
jgi:periplasmic protein TonB